MTEQPPQNPEDNTDDIARIVMLVFGKTKDRKGSYWCYVAIKPSKHKPFMELYQQGKMNLFDFEKSGFGEIVVSGKGRTPPSEITHQVAQIYRLNLNELFQENDGQQALEKKILQFQKPEEA